MPAPPPASQPNPRPASQPSLNPAPQPTPPPERSLFAFGAVSFTYFAYAGLFGTYAPLWFQHLGFTTLAIGALASMQSATRLFSPYAWGWLADHTGRRTQLLRVAVALALGCAGALFLSARYAWIGAVTVALFVCTAGVIPISEAALAQVVSRGAVVDAARYGRVRVWGSIGFIVAVVGSGALLQAAGVQAFPWLVVALLAGLLVAALRLPVVAEPAHGSEAAAGALAVLRQPVVAWFFAGVFFAVLAHMSLYAFFSLYLVSLGYSKTAVGFIWALGVAVEVAWFWFQGGWLARYSAHTWLAFAAGVAALRFGATAAFGAIPAVLVLAQCTHAITFGAQHSACIAVVSRHFPGRLRGRGQALYTVLGYGASGVIGGVAGGAVSEAMGFPAVFWAASGSAVIAALCAARAGALDRRAARTAT
jgi:MFS transporter, PPP family, 3-phenylpropionic acid transporter